MLKDEVNIQILKADRRLITFFEPFFEMKIFRAAKRAFAFEILVRIASYRPQIDQISHITVSFFSVNLLNCQYCVG